MDIFACRNCKKSKSHKAKYAENEGYSSADDEYYSPPDNEVKPQLKGVKEEGSLRRPLQCKLPFGKRQQGKNTSKPKSRTDEISTSNFLETTWRSLPNLRSPSLAVRAMTLKFRALTGGDNNTTIRTEVKRKKKARFNEAVDVILHDDDGELLCTQIVKIKYDDDDSLGFDLDKTMATANENTNGEPMPPPNRRPNPDAIRMDFMDIKRNQDGHKYLKCVIFIGEEFDRRRITVRTAMGGSRLVLIAYKSEPLGDGSHYWQQFTEKFRLPHAIDPNQVNATMHSAGDLVIEAPLFDFETDT